MLKPMLALVTAGMVGAGVPATQSATTGAVSIHDLTMVEESGGGDTTTYVQYRYRAGYRYHGGYRYRAGYRYHGGYRYHR